MKLKYLCLQLVGDGNGFARYRLLTNAPLQLRRSIPVSDYFLQQ